MATPILTTAACNTYLSPLSVIDGTDCIGDSRLYINENFQNIASDLCTLYLTTSSLSARPTQDSRVDILSAFLFTLGTNDSSTVDLSFDPSTYTLSANIVDSSIGTAKLGQNITTFGKRVLTSTNLFLSGLGDVQLSPLSNNQVLKWTGSYWTNQTDATSVSGLLTDGNKVEITVSNFGQTWTINNDAITENKIDDGAVSENKLVNESVTQNKIGPEAVIESKIATNAVTSSKLSAAAVTEPKIASNAVTTSKIANATDTATGVTNTKLRHSSALSVIGRSTNSTGAPADIQATTNNTVLIRASDTLSFGVVPNSATTGASTSAANTLVLRDTSGNFAANNITAASFIGNLTGNAATANSATTAGSANSANTANSATTAGTAGSAGQLTTARDIALGGAVTGSASFNGSSNITINTVPGPGLTSNYFRATEVYASNTTRTNMSIRTLYAGAYTSNTNGTPTAAGTTLDSRPTNVWRRFNTTEYSASFASIKQFNNVWGTYIEITSPGIYEIHAAGTLSGARAHCVALFRFDPGQVSPAYTSLATGTIISNDPDATEDSSTSIVGGRFSFTGNRNGIALMHIYRNDEKTAKDVILGAESFPPPWNANASWLSIFLPNVVTAWFEVKKIS